MATDPVEAWGGDAPQEGQALQKGCNKSVLWAGRCQHSSLLQPWAMLLFLLVAMPPGDLPELPVYFHCISFMTLNLIII